MKQGEEPIEEIGTENGSEEKIRDIKDGQSAEKQVTNKNEAEDKESNKNQVKEGEFVEEQLADQGANIKNRPRKTARRNKKRRKSRIEDSQIDLDLNTDVTAGDSGLSKSKKELEGGIQDSMVDRKDSSKESHDSVIVNEINNVDMELENMMQKMMDIKF